MSENAAIVATTKKSPKKTLVIVLSVLVLLLVYGAGFIVLPIAVLTHFQSRNCESVLSLNKLYTRLYPRFIQDATLAAPVSECQAYVSATSSEEKGLWHESYDAYQAYSTAYPNGLFATDAHQRSGFVLVNLAREQAEQKKYEEAVASLDQVVASYSDTGVINEAWGLYPSMYISWGTSRRDAADFEAAEQVFNTFLTWSQHNQRPESATDAQKELVQTYLAWGLDLQGQKQFEDAIAKFDLAVSMDPQAQFDSAAQVSSVRQDLYMEWGDDLLEQQQFQAAIEKYQLAVSLADGTDADAPDALANAYIQLANDLSAGEDFLGALEHLKTAKDTAQSEDMKKSVEAAFGQTYLAFSKSTGSQAQQAMKDVLKTVCEKHKAPDLPIFGLNKDLVRAAIYGADTEFPEDLQATTPGEMHYVACVEVQRETIASDYNDKYYRLMGGDTVYVTFIFYRYRVQVNWSISLRKSNTGEEVTTELFKGALPPNFPREWKEETYEGAPPTLDVVVKWIASEIK